MMHNKPSFSAFHRHLTAYESMLDQLLDVYEDKVYHTNVDYVNRFKQS